MALAIPMPQLRDTGTWLPRRCESTQPMRSNRRRIDSDPQPQQLIKYQHLLRVPIAGQGLLEMWQRYVRTVSAPRLDKGAALRNLSDLRALPPDWDGYGAAPIDRRIIQAAADFILSLPSDIAATPNAVPMTRGRLQFEWHRGNRSLELEFEGSDRLHYLKWDSDANVEEEDVISVDDTGTVHALLRWFASEPVNV